MKIFRSGEYLCCNDKKAHIFLAGPTSRDDSVISWRLEALELLEKNPFSKSLIVSVPEPFCDEYDKQVYWEEKHLNMATCILFWIPRDLKTLPGFTTNIEFGEWYKSGKIVLGYPKDAPKMKYLQHKANAYSIPVFHSLKDTVNEAVYWSRQNRKKYK